jgi:phytoene desaturase
MPKTAIIIGAGLGGMATAIRLAREGWSVKILEKNVRVGGKLTCVNEAGFLWDAGPSLVTMPFLLRDLFEVAGQDIDNYLELLPMDPVCRCFFPGGKAMNAWSNLHHFRIELARREKDHGESFEKFMRYTRGIYNLLSEAYLSCTAKKFINFRLIKHLYHLPKVFASRTMTDQFRRFFKEPMVQQFFYRYTTSVGSSPYLTPSLFSVIPFMEMQDGGWYTRGGVYHLAEAMERSARDLGVEILVDAEVTEIALEMRKWPRRPIARAVLLRGGLRFDADAVICNTDIMHAWQRLIQAPCKDRVVRNLENQIPSMSPFMIFWGVNRRYEQLAHRNVFFSSDYQAEFDDIFVHKRPPAEPTIHVTISARTDPTQAPPGQDNFFVHVNMPALEPDHHWDQLRDSYRNLVLERLEKMGLEDLRKHIVCERVITPADFAARNNAYRGTTYGQACHSLASVFCRSPNRSKEIRNLYFVGGCVQPGGTIPLVLLSAQHTAELVSSDIK